MFKVNKNAERRVSSMRFVILDDDILFAKVLQDQISMGCAKRDWQLSCEIFSSPQKLLESDLSRIQVAFLDIDMPEINGIEVAFSIQKKYPNIILVFVTNYIQYAPVGYKTNAFRYILKSQYREEIDSSLDAIKEKILEDNETILINQKDFTLEIALKEILYFEGTPYRRVLLHTTYSEKLECLGKLGDYEKRLQEKGFVRIHKSFLVNMCYITQLANYSVRLKNGIKLKASESNYKQISNQYLVWKGKHL